MHFVLLELEIWSNFKVFDINLLGFGSHSISPRSLFRFHFNDSYFSKNVLISIFWFRIFFSI